MAKYILKNENINEICEQLGTFLDHQRLDRKDIARCKLSIEETLLDYQKKFGKDKEITVNFSRAYGNVKLNISIAGEAYNPYSGEEEEGSLLRSLYSNYGLFPTWSYKNGTNVISLLSKRKKMSTSMAIVIALAIAFILGYGVSFFSDNVKQVILNDFVTPTTNTFVGLITAVASPMIFLAISYGICSIGSIETFGKIGSHVVKIFIKWTIIFSVILSLVALFMVNINYDTELGFTTTAVSSIYQMLLDIVPGNLFQPFIDANPLQVIFWAVLFGSAALILGKKIAIAYTVIEQFNSLVLLTMELISSMVPAFIFLCFFSILLSAEVSLLYQIAKLILIALVLFVTVVVLDVIRLVIKVNAPIFVVLKKLWPTFFIGLTTGSSSAAFATNIDTCMNGLGIEEKLVNFSIPLGQVIYMPGTELALISTSIFMAEQYQIAVTPVWIISLIIVAAVLAIAAPPVPGGIVTCYTIIFLQLGIPMEALGVAVAANAVLDFLATAANLFSLQIEATFLAKELEMLDENVLSAVVE